MGSDFLFVYPSFLTGAGRIADLWGDRVYNLSPGPEMADHLAAKADWLCVGDDLRLAMEQHRASCDEDDGVSDVR